MPAAAEEPARPDQEVSRATAGGGELPDVNEVRFKLEGIYHLCNNNLYFTVHSDTSRTDAWIARQPKLFFFSSAIPESYLPFRHEWGPNHMLDVLDFVATVRDKVRHPLLAGRKIVYYTPEDPEVITNTAFLLACYLMLEEGFTPESAASRVERVRGLPIVPFRDAGEDTDPCFDLSILDCLRGLNCAVKLGWLDPATFQAPLYGRIAFDISRVSPRLVAFATPRDHPDDSGLPARPTEGHIAPLRGLGVTDVVRLSEEGLYDDAVLAHKFKHHALEFTDGAQPPARVVRDFLDACDAAEGVVAVHCLAGLGRTGTLIAVHMIKHCGFTAREAIGYMRLVRPGSIMGCQQRYLEDIEAAMWHGNLPLLGREEEEDLVTPKGGLDYGKRFTWGDEGCCCGVDGWEDDGEIFSVLNHQPGLDAFSCVPAV